jgi:hypothetical protein
VNPALQTQSPAALQLPCPLQVSLALQSNITKLNNGSVLILVKFLAFFACWIAKEIGCTLLTSRTSKIFVTCAATSSVTTSMSVASDL